ncbi:MAG: bifunctional heptose 7-phosphate kinase/heptose 1-phosphate adenyltransferase [Synergistaceae bacterium]|jgi:D-beta-D-heptose 7-phosphate kinase/D-beta-D-heptose 1-phosphate adenosyltransferase|nr:bifunctional heptose 7-phosphate kinase/heptose 1-phosphate adenyltransferase [Synergistaceae bacterium]
MSGPLDFLRAGRMAELNVVILGDVVLDRYLLGATSRVSREAPIPVVVCNGATDNLGGAGNVAANLRGLGCRASLIGSAGEDESGLCLRRHLDERGVEARLFRRPSPTLTKTRLICGGQQVARFDHETTDPLDDRTAADAVRRLREILDGDKVGAVVLSDYGLGFCTASLCGAAIDAARERGVPTFVDPRGSDWSRYRGATIATPNLSELAAVWGAPVPNEDGTVVRVGESVRRASQMEWLLVTRSAHGMTLIGADGAVHMGARPVEVFDVSGAGDTVIASLAACVAAGFPMEEASRFANEAAQIVVTRSGTWPISAAELLEELCGHDEICDPPRFLRAASRQTAVRTCGDWKKQGYRVVFTNGCFDILHAGHVDSLERARGLGDRLIVGLNSDRSVRALKGAGRPVNGEENRARLLAALRVVDLVVVFDEDTPASLLSELRPHVLAKGGDYRVGELPGREFVDEVVILPLVDGLSTTAIIEKTGFSGAFGP